MNKTEFVIWGRTLSLKVEYDVYPGEEILETQREAIDKLLSKIPECLRTPSEVIKYCKKANKDLFTDDVDNIFRYVMPTSILVKHSEKKRIVAILCNYRYDDENGIAIVLENEKLLEIGPQDIIL